LPINRKCRDYYFSFHHGLIGGLLRRFILRRRFSNMVMGGSGLRAKVERAIREIRPRLRADGGDIELVDVDEGGIVKVKLKGACAGCPMSQMTLKLGVERYIKEKIPQVERVETV
jgi:Fe-S cluster biogenesis protein NfuA